jgi:hypothetical protein
LFLKDDKVEYRNYKLFSEIEEGKLTRLTPVEFQFPKEICIGHHKYRHALFKVLKESKTKRLIGIQGRSRSGRKFIARHTAEFLR